MGVLLGQVARHQVLACSRLRPRRRPRVNENHALRTTARRRRPGQSNNGRTDSGCPSWTNMSSGIFILITTPPGCPTRKQEVSKLKISRAGGWKANEPEVA